MRTALHFRRLIAVTGSSLLDRYLSSVTSGRLAELGLGMESLPSGPAVFLVSCTLAARAGRASVNSAALTRDTKRGLPTGVCR